MKLTDPELWKAAIAVGSAYAQNRTAKSGRPSFTAQPETPEEKAYRAYAEKLAGMNGTPGPTYQYLAPQIDAGLQRVAASTAGYQPLNRLDVATGKEIPRAALPATAYNQFASQPWIAAPAGPRPNGATAGAEPGQRLYSGDQAPSPVGGGYRPNGPFNNDWSSPSDYRNSITNPQGSGSGMSPATNASLDPNNPTVYHPPGSTANPSMGYRAPIPPGMSYGDAAQLTAFGKQYGKAATEAVIAIITANPIWGAKAAIDWWKSRQGGGTPPGGATGGTTPPPGGTYHDDGSGWH